MTKHVSSVVVIIVDTRVRLSRKSLPNIIVVMSCNYCRRLQTPIISWNPKVEEKEKEKEKTKYLVFFPSKPFEITPSSLVHSIGVSEVGCGFVVLPSCDRVFICAPAIAKAVG